MTKFSLFIRFFIVLSNDCLGVDERYIVENCQKWFMILLISQTYPGLEITIFLKLPGFPWACEPCPSHISPAAVSHDGTSCLFVSVSLFVWAVRVEMAPLRSQQDHYSRDVAIWSVKHPSVELSVDQTFEPGWKKCFRVTEETSHIPSAFSLSFWHLLGRQSLSQKSQLPISVSPGPRQTGFSGLWFDCGPRLLTNQLAPTLRSFCIAISHSLFSLLFEVTFLADKSGTVAKEME